MLQSTAKESINHENNSNALLHRCDVILSSSLRNKKLKSTKRYRIISLKHWKAYEIWVGAY